MSKHRTKDELYVIIKGHATLLRGGKRISYKKSYIIFVPAGMNHWFENFSDDFATWVIFYRAAGGENRSYLTNNFINSATPSVAGFSIAVTL
ncbi:MAG TPA: cupin domain-containing protein [Chitinophagaceae bacterium]|jgi:oxalate decarboxylase/phosphoglucose isomerase-like protein (cupin superfamily)|nr:cupin domain-containing protein [Chitinophagaceae bacterium]